MNTTDNQTVYKLASLDDWQLENSDQDLRGQSLALPDGRPVGRVDDMLVDLDRERVAALRLADDRIVDIDHVDIRDGKPVLLVPLDRIPPAAPGFDRGNITSEHIPIVEERLEVGKREVELSTVRVRSRAVAETVGRDVDLTEEHVRVERRPVDQPVTGAQADVLLKDRTIEATETAERPVVTREAAVTGEVSLEKVSEQHREHVERDVRHTEVELERDSDARQG